MTRGNTVAYLPKLVTSKEDPIILTMSNYSFNLELSDTLNLVVKPCMYIVRGFGFDIFLGNVFW